MGEHGLAGSSSGLPMSRAPRQGKVPYLPFPTPSGSWGTSPALPYTRLPCTRPASCTFPNSLCCWVLPS